MNKTRAEPCGLLHVAMSHMRPSMAGTCSLQPLTYMLVSTGVLSGCRSGRGHVCAAACGCCGADGRSHRRVRRRSDCRRADAALRRAGCRCCDAPRSAAARRRRQRRCRRPCRHGRGRIRGIVCRTGRLRRGRLTPGHLNQSCPAMPLTQNVCSTTVQTQCARSLHCTNSHGCWTAPEGGCSRSIACHVAPLQGDRHP